MTSLRPSNVVAPLLIVVQLSVPVPFVVKTWPLVPSALGHSKLSRLILPVPLGAISMLAFVPGLIVITPELTPPLVTKSSAYVPLLVIAARLVP